MIDTVKRMYVRGLLVAPNSTIVAVLLLSCAAGAAIGVSIGAFMVHVVEPVGRYAFGTSGPVSLVIMLGASALAALVVTAFKVWRSK